MVPASMPPFPPNPQTLKVYVYVCTCEDARVASDKDFEA